MLATKQASNLTTKQASNQANKQIANKLIAKIPVTKESLNS